jgi:hypothetical protein
LYKGQAIEYQNQQRAYEEAQRGNNNNNNENNQNRGWTCQWYQYQCRKNRAYYMQQSGNGDQIYTPEWYTFLGGKSEMDQRDREEAGLQGQATGALKFVYSWTMIMFIGILIYGVFSFYRCSAHIYPLGVISTMLVFAQFCILMLIVLCQGVITTENRELENSVYGWYGQMGVLMVYTNFWYFVHCFLFSIILTLRTAFALWRHRRENNNINTFDDNSHLSVPPNKSHYSPELDEVEDARSYKNADFA